MISQNAFIAANRFGLGPRPGELLALSGDPHTALFEQLSSPVASGAVPLSSAVIDAMRDLATGRKDGTGSEAKKRLDDARLAFQNDRLARQVTSTAPFRERLALFWSNHFSVTARKGGVGPLAFAMEREAILPHVTGKFIDLARAAILHPAMLIYLDLASAVGPQSERGGQRKRGLNENLAREILELHTLGVDGGYTQDDIKALAAILTGWRVNYGRRDQNQGVADYGFDLPSHQPGAKTLLGTTIADGGEDETEAALKLIVGRPATARFIATKLVRHFVADDPPPAAVETIAATFVDSQGDLMKVYGALLGLDASWRDPLAKFKTPWDLAISTCRAFDTTDVFRSSRHLEGVLRQMGQQSFDAPSPAGWPDRTEAWLGPSALLLRIALAERAAQLMAARTDVAALFENTIGVVASSSSRDIVLGAGSSEEAVTLLLASPEFQRR